MLSNFKGIDEIISDYQKYARFLLKFVYNIWAVEEILKYIQIGQKCGSVAWYYSMLGK